ncbi:MAG: type II secretion system protein [Candidatus Wallbacteria bacterium]|nr:type II secretion system protein [Candidatus Wallbacteria bacterium]
MTKPRPASRGAAFTLVELLVALAILSGALSLVHFALFGGTRSYARSRARMDLEASCRAALGRVQSDVRRAAGFIEVTDDGAELKLSVLDLGGSGLPSAGPGGKFSEKPVVYRFDAPNKRLLRREDSKEEILGRGLPDVVFSQRVFEIGAVKYSAVTARVTAVLDDRPFGIEASAVPRLQAGWAANPAWVFTTIGAPYEFKVDQ